MSRDGQGNYNLPEAAFVDGTTIDATKVNDNFSDIGAALTQSLSKDGQTVPTANLPMGNFRHTGVAAATARTHYLRADQYIDGSLVFAEDSGTADAYAITLSPGITAYVEGQSFWVKIAHANLTTTPTFVVNGLTAGTITWPDGTALAAGDLPANACVEFECAAVSTGTPTWHLMTPTGAPVYRTTTQTITGNKTFSGNLTVTAGTNSYLGALGSSTATTQSQGDNSTKVATTAYADRIGASAPGTWTPVDASGASLSFTGVTAKYVQVGNLVFAYFSLTFPSTADGTPISIGGLPVTAANANYANTASMLQNSGAANITYGVVVKNTQTFGLWSATAGHYTNSGMSGLTVSGLIIYPTT